MSTTPQEPLPPAEERAGERSEKAGEGNLGRAFALGTGMFFTAAIVFVIGLAVILYFIFS